MPYGTRFGALAVYPESLDLVFAGMGLTVGVNAVAGKFEFEDPAAIYYGASGLFTFGSWPNITVAVFNECYLGGITGLTGTNLPKLKELYCSADVELAEPFALTNLGELTKVVVTGTNLWDVTITNCPKLVHLDMNTSAMQKEVLDAILTVLIANGLSNGYVDLSGANTPPYIDFALKTTLEERGWTVIVDVP